MGIFRFEWKQYRKSALTWSVVLGACIVVFTIMFADTVMNEMANLKDLLSSNPFYAAMGLDIDTFFSILGLFGYLHGLMTLAGAVQAMNMGMSLISKEYMYNTADFLMTKPYSRINIFTQKILAALFVLLITGVIYIGSAIAAVQYAAAEYCDLKALLLICFTFPIIQLLFLSLGLLIAAVKFRIPNVLPISLAIAFVAYCVGMGAEVLESNALRCFSPFKYFPTTDMILDHSYDIKYLLLCISCTILFFAIAGILYVKKDIKSL